jgi:hypothetical protein
MAIWNIFRTFGDILFLFYLVHFLFVWYTFSGFGIMYQEKSGNPAIHTYVHFSNKLPILLPRLDANFAPTRRFAPTTLRLGANRTI